jgi:phage shock protein C
MYCTKCGVQIDDQALYCSQCGAATMNATSARASQPRRPLSRPREDIKVAGVCAGVARYLDMDVTLVRILWVVLSIYPPGAGILAYFICMMVMPKDPLPPVTHAEPAPAAQV